MAALNTLPNELLALVASHLDHPKDILNLSLSSHRLHQFALNDGWRAFLRGRFRVKNLDNDARTAVHGLTTLHRNWDRKALLARFVEPPARITSLNSWRGRKWVDASAARQTMGYQPCIDSYETLHGKWTERREVLGWSAGTQVVLRVKETETKADAYTERIEKDDKEDNNEEYHQAYEIDAFQHLNSWYAYKIPESAEGVDDITSMKLLRPHQKSGSGAASATAEHAVFGTASGRLALLSADLDLRETREQQYDTGGRSVASLSLSLGDKPLLSAVLGDTTLALYPISAAPTLSPFSSPSSSSSSPTPDSPSPSLHAPLSTVSALPSSTTDRLSRIWSCNYISGSNVALGLGLSTEPIHIYTLTPAGYHPTPLRKFTIDAKNWSDESNEAYTQFLSTQHRLGVSPRTSIYPVVPIPAANSSSSADEGSPENHIFLSGGYDGIVRLHDMRSPRGFEALYFDMDDSAIYSLACQTPQRFIAGCSMHSRLKVFDLRLSGAATRRAYTYYTCPSTTIPTTDITPSPTLKPSRSWTLFLNPRTRYRHRTPDPPVYTLSLPSPLSQTLYAGLEAKIEAITLTSLTDAHPDPHLSRRGAATTHTPTQHAAGSHTTIAHHRKRNRDPRRDDVLCLAMFEEGAKGTRLKVQRGVEEVLVMMKSKKKKGDRDDNHDDDDDGLDDRWVGLSGRDEEEGRGGRHVAAAGSGRGGGCGGGGHARLSGGGRGRGRGRERERGGGGQH